MHKPLLGVYTPILHIPNLYEDLEKNFEIIYHPDSDYENALININKFNNYLLITVDDVFDLRLAALICSCSVSFALSSSL